MADLYIVPAVERDKRERNAEAVSILRAALEDAEAGHLDGVILLCEVDGVLQESSARIGDRYRIAGLIEALKVKLLRDP